MSVSGGTVDALANEICMAHMAGVLLDHVDQQPTDIVPGPGRASSDQDLVEVVDAGEDLARLLAGGVVQREKVVGAAGCGAVSGSSIRFPS